MEYITINKKVGRLVYGNKYRYQAGIGKVLEIWEQGIPNVGISYLIFFNDKDSMRVFNPDMVYYHNYSS